MKHLMRNLFFVFAAVFLLNGLAAAPKNYLSVKVEGLKLLTGRFLVNSGAIKQTDKGYVVDRKSLENTMRKEKMIAKFKLIDKNNTLLIIVEEKRPVVRVAVSGADNVRMLEIDASCRIVSVDEAYLPDAPLVYVSAADVSGGGIKGRSRILVKKLIEDKDVSPVWNEISSIDIRKESVIIVKLRNRPTEILCDDESCSIQRINALAGYLDKAKYYPETIYIKGSVAVIK